METYLVARRPGDAALVGALVGSSLLLAAAVWDVIQRGRTARFIRGEVGATWVTHYAATRMLTAVAAVVLLGASAVVLLARRHRALPPALLLVASAALAVIALQVSPAHFGNAFSTGVVSRYPTKYGLAALIAGVGCASGVLAAAIEIATRRSRTQIH